MRKTLTWGGGEHDVLLIDVELHLGLLAVDRGRAQLADLRCVLVQANWALCNNNMMYIKE